MIKIEWNDEYSGAKVKVEIDEEMGLEHVLSAFESFLLAAGFKFDGELDIVGSAMDPSDLN